jgi:ubiquinone/menaquinone biosynthesis C-methylase UbiE
MAVMAAGPRLYDTLLEPLVKGFREAGVDLVGPQSGMRVLDVGCGTGTHLALYAARGCAVTGVDLNQDMLNRATGRLGPGATLLEADATALPFDDGAFDLAITMTVLHEMAPEDRLAALGEMSRVAGLVLVIDYHPEPDGSLRGKVIRGVSTGIERIAGGDHYRNYREFVTSGGLPDLAGRARLTVTRSAREASGSMGVYLLASRR